MINWDNCSPLTREEFDAFISMAIPFLKSMEYKNRWDFFINDMSIRWFCDRFFIEGFEFNDYEDYQEHYTKVKDMYAILDILMEADWTPEDEILRRDKEVEIWKLVLDKVNAIADSVF